MFFHTVRRNLFKTQTASAHSRNFSSSGDGISRIAKQLGIFGVAGVAAYGITLFLSEQVRESAESVVESQSGEYYAFFCMVLFFALSITLELKLCFQHRFISSRHHATSIF